MVKVKESVEDEWDFKVMLLKAIHAHSDVYVNYIKDVFKEIYKLGSRIGNRDLLNALRKVRREIGISDETTSDTGKFENLKPLVDYLGLLGKYSSGRRVVYIQCIDPELLFKLLQKYSKETKNIQIAEFTAWMDRGFLPAIDEVGEPYNSVKNAFSSSESLRLIKMDNPADFRKVLNIGGRKVSRIRIQ